MKPLDACQIAVAARREDDWARARSEALQQAGAVVFFCTPNRDVWLALSERSFDAIVLLLERCDADSLAMYDQLREDARSRATPLLLVTSTVGHTAGRTAAVVSDTADDAGFVHSIAELVDSTRRLRAAEQLERSLREQLRHEAKRAEHSTRDLADLAHELRAMLGAMIGFASNLRDQVAGPLLADQEWHVAGIIDAVERANRLLDKTLKGSLPAEPLPSIASTSAPPRVQRSSVQLARLAAEVVALFEGVARRKSIRLHSAYDETVCVWGDALKLKQVVTNLLVNALKFTPQAGEVMVSVSWSAPGGAGHMHARRAAEVIVSDTGPGIALEHRQRVFERGFRIEHSGANGSIGGQGIGLALVREIVLQHGGTVRVDGEPGAGSVFRVALPQDRRQRAQAGALVVRQGAAGQALLDLLRASAVEKDGLVTPQDREQFMHLALACRAAVLLASDDELDAALLSGSVAPTIDVTGGGSS